MINVDKTKELVIAIDKWNNLELEPVILGGNPIEFVCNFKYLGTHVDAQLCFMENTDSIYKKLNKGCI